MAAEMLADSSRFLRTLSPVQICRYKLDPNFCAWNRDVRRATGFLRHSQLYTPSFFTSSL